MLKRHFCHIDNITGKELLISGASYNLAMHWLDKQLKNAGFEVTSATYQDNIAMFVIKTYDNNNDEEGRTYWYDEERGYLLGC